MAITPGARLGRYEILAPLGKGGMGVVYRARDGQLSRDVAVKVLSPAYSTDPDRLRRFEQEARAASALNHPNILTIYDVGSHDGSPYIVCELLEGTTLRGRLADGGLPIRKIVDYAALIAEALAAAHEKGIVHRDLKPANVFLTPGGGLKVIDFGLAKLTPTARSSSPAAETPTLTCDTDPGVVMGTAGYMSPEQVRGQATDHRSDIFSLGAILYEMLTGARAFHGATRADTMSAILRQDPLQAVQPRPDLPPTLEPVLRRCLEKEAAERFQSARDLAFALRQAAGHSRAAAIVPARSRRWLRPAVVALFLVLLVAAIARLILHRGASEPDLAVGSPLRAVAVLPFVFRSSDPEREYLSDGITEELIHALGRVEGLRVTGRTSSFAFKGKEIDLAEVGRTLGVDGVVVGSVQTDGDRVRIRAELVKVAGGLHLWSQSYDRLLEDVFAVQEDVARSIARELRLRLGGAPGGPTPDHPRPDPVAYELYMRGRQAWTRRTEDGLKQAVGLFREAIAHDEGFARAHSGVADAYVMLASYQYVPGDEMWLLAEAATSRALALDDSLAEAHTSRGMLLSGRLEWDEAEGEFRRAIALNASYVTTHNWYAGLLLQRGRLDEALERARAATELDPLAPSFRGMLANAWLFLGDIRAATSQARRGHELGPEFFGPLSTLSRVYAAEGDGVQALRSARQAVERAPSNPLSRTFLARAEARFGEVGEAHRILAQLESQPHPCAVCIVDVTIALGRTDRIADWPPTFWPAGGFFYPKVDPAYDAVRDTPAFQELLRRLKLQ